ncbi:MAG: hypothetical protein V9E82_09165 [Candidatus Nanopelagicales bacterium]
MKWIVIFLALFLAPTPALAYDSPGQRWPGTTIRVHETFPASWNWSLQRAFETWNDAGAKIRFRVVRRGGEQVTLGYGDTGGYAGLATIGRRTGAFLRIEPLIYKPLRKRDRVSAAIVLAHELGHVLGLGHSGLRGCRLMAARPLSFCPTPPRPWQAHCRWLSRDDVRGLLDLYGGRDRRPESRWCLREPQPPGLQVLFGAGQVSWEPVATLPGTRVRIEAYPTPECVGPAITVERRVSAGYWSGRALCVRIGLVNKYGMPGPVSTGTVV